jgi:Holliday junction resolvase RusA-like endonuclease
VTAAGPTLDVRFFVPGTVVPKGNHQAFPIARGRCQTCKTGRPCRQRNCFGGTIVGTVVTDAGGDELEAWQQMISVLAMSARNLAGQRVVKPPGAVEVAMVFLLPRPAGHWTESGRLTKEGAARPHATVKPDWDKVSRAAADGLTGSLVVDDSQIVVARVAKVPAPWRGPTGVAIHARQISSFDGWIEHELQYAGIGLEPRRQLELG